MSGEEASRTLAIYLWDYEKTEILEYKEIYFLGLNADKTKG